MQSKYLFYDEAMECCPYKDCVETAFELYGEDGPQGEIVLKSRLEEVVQNMIQRNKERRFSR